MVGITAKACKSTTVFAPFARAVDTVRDVRTFGGYSPGVERIEDLGGGRYRWIIEERNTLGMSFKADYVNRYSNVGSGAVAFETESGNMTVQGTWQVSGEDREVTVTIDIESVVDLPVPRLLAGPARVFAQRELTRAIAAQLERFKRAIE